MPSRPLQVLHAPGQGPGYHRDCSMRMTGGRPGAHRYGLDHEEGAGAGTARRAEVRGGQVCPERGAWPRPHWAGRGRLGPPEGNRLAPGYPRTGAPQPRPRQRCPGCPGVGCPRGPARRFATSRVSSPVPTPRDGQGGSVRGGVGGRARCRKATPPWEVLRPPQVTSIPCRSTGSFSGKPAPARSPAPNRRQLLPVPDDPSPHPPGKT